MSTTTCECRSPQEQRLYDKIEGKEDKFRKTHTRVFKLLERFEGQKPRIDIERALYFTQSMGDVISLLGRFAHTDATVLILGETGAGKDVFARYTHSQSARSDKILLKVDCGGISESLTESELFGYMICQSATFYFY